MCVYQSFYFNNGGHFNLFIIQTDCVVLEDLNYTSCVVWIDFKLHLYVLFSDETNETVFKISSFYT